jgi:hypothetical protein
MLNLRGIDETNRWIAAGEGKEEAQLAVKTLTASKVTIHY